MASVNNISGDYILTGPNSVKDIALPTEQTESFVRHLMRNLEEQLAGQEDLKNKTWLLNFLTREKVVYGEVLGKIKK
jgi:hypothetical protein